MKLTQAELADRYTILCLKREHGLPVEEDVSQYAAELMQVDCSELLTVNRRMWELEDQISQTTDLAEIGALYLELRAWTLQRVAAKNRIAERCGEPREVKGY